MAKHSLLVSEIFGHTIQGEGASCGQQASFLRLGGCNLQCVWCDTPYTWDWTGKNGTKYDIKSELSWMEYGQVSEQLIECSVTSTTMLVVTGGEPMLQYAQLDEFFLAMGNHGYSPWRIEIETAGTVAWDFIDDGIYFNVSPKLENSGNKLEMRYRLDVLMWLMQTGRATFKFVVQNDGDLAEVDQIVSEVKIHPSLVWIMPEGVASAVLSERMAAIAEKVIARGYNLSPRLHVDIWGTRRGV